MIFCAFRYQSGVTVAEEFDVRLVRSAKGSRAVFGIIPRIEAYDKPAAEQLARERFAAGDFDLTHRGQEICQSLLEKARGGK